MVVGMETATKAVTGVRHGSRAQAWWCISVSALAVALVCLGSAYLCGPG